MTGRQRKPVGAIIVPFPLARRVDLVRRTAEQMLARPPAQAERHLQLQICRQAKAMARKQLRPNAIIEEIGSFESAVRAELWRLVMSPRRPTGAA